MINMEVVHEAVNDKHTASKATAIPVKFIHISTPLPQLSRQPQLMWYFD